MEQAETRQEGVSTASEGAKKGNTRLTMKTATGSKFEGFRAKGVKASDADTPKKALRQARKAANAIREAGERLRENVVLMEGTSTLIGDTRWSERARFWDDAKGILTDLGDALTEFLMAYFDAPCFSRLRERDLVNEEVRRGADRVKKAFREGVPQ